MDLRLASSVRTFKLKNGRRARGGGRAQPPLDAVIQFMGKSAEPAGRLIAGQAMVVDQPPRSVSLLPDHGVEVPFGCVHIGDRRRFEV
jgi:hypothetical protein